MDWNGSLRPYVSRPETSLNFLYNYNYDPYPVSGIACTTCFVGGAFKKSFYKGQKGASQMNLLAFVKALIVIICVYTLLLFSGMDVKHQALAQTPNVLIPAMDKINYGSSHEKKKRLTCDQLESLERSFQEEIKLDPDRKMKLSGELGLQPRQIAVWFQNRRARWKAKQLERLYDALKQEFDAVSKEKQRLQEEIMKLKAVLREQATRKQVSTGYTEISGEETVESTSVAAVRSSNKPPRGTSHHQIAECNYHLNVDEYNPVASPYWALMPSYP